MIEGLLIVILIVLVYLLYGVERILREVRQGRMFVESQHAAAEIQEIGRKLDDELGGVLEDFLVAVRALV